jgi:uncharacterized protein YhaN
MNDHRPTALTPLTLIAAETGGDADTLAVKFADAVTLDGAGLRCVPTDTARQYITDHRAALQAEQNRKAAQREAARQQPHPVRERIRALQRQQEEWEGSTDVPALAVMTASDVEASMNASSARMDEMLAGEMVVHRIRQRDDR